MPSFGDQRAAMVEQHLAARGIDDERVLAAMAKVPREEFVGEAMREFAYEDRALPIGEEQTISQPYIVALMIAAAHIAPGDRVLEVGAGSGYAAAVLSRIAEEVFAVERHESLASRAQERLARLGYDNVRVFAGDGSSGLSKQAPFDAILVAAGGDSVPEPLRQQLAIGGRLIAPVGGRLSQKLWCLTRTGEDDWTEECLGDVRFVPLIGAHGRWENGSHET